MLASIRRSAKSWAAAAILFLALVAIVITGFGTDGFGGLGSLSSSQTQGEILASVDGRELTEQEVADIVNRQYAEARRQQPTLEIAAFVGSGFNNVVQQMVMSLAVEAFGDEQGLIVSPRMIDREIINIPGFRNFSGQFDEANFRAALDAQNISEAQLRRDIARSLIQRQLLGPVARGAAVPEGLARAYSGLLLERRRGAIGVVPAELLRQGVAPTEAELAAYYQANRARFTLPERRVVQYALIGPEQVGGAAQATEQEIADVYRRNAGLYAGQERRTIQHLVLPSRQQADQAAQLLRSGTGFAEVASRFGFAASDLTYANQAQADFAGETHPEVAQAAFAAPQGAVAGPIAAEGTFHVVRVEAVTRTEARPLEAVRGDIVRAIERRKLVEAIGAIVNRIEDQLAEGASLADVARAERLTVVTTPPLTSTGQAPGQDFTAPPELQALLRTAFEIDAEDPEPLVEQIVANQRFAVVTVERAIPAEPPPLAQIRDRVRSALVEQRGLDRARALADQIAARINRGMAAAAAFAQAQPRMPTPEPVNVQRLEVSRAGGGAPPPLSLLFRLPEGRAEVLEAPNRAGFFVVHLAERIPGNAASQPELIVQTRSEFATTAAEELAQQFARAIELASDVERHPDAIARARQRLLGITPQ